MIDIKGIGAGLPVPPEEEEKHRLKEIKTRAGRIAFLRALGGDAKVSEVHQGITKSEGALKWIDEVFNRGTWKDS